MNFKLNHSLKNKFWAEIPPWTFIGAVLVLSPIFTYITFDTIHRQQQNSVKLLIEKGAALIRSFEAGTRTGLIGDFWGTLQLQKLLYETARQPDIEYLFVADTDGKIIAHSNSLLTGKHLNLTVQGKTLDLTRVASENGILWQIVSTGDGRNVLVIFRKFEPSVVPKALRFKISKYNENLVPDKVIEVPSPDRIIFVGLDMSSVEKAGKLEIRDTILTGIILLLTGFAGVILLFIIQAYRSTRTSLSRIKAFSDTLVENMPIGLIAFDNNLNIMSFNNVAKSILSLPQNLNPGAKAEKILSEDLYSQLTLLDRGNQIVENTIECRMASGETLPLEVSAAYLRDEDGYNTGYICIFKDLTEVRSLKMEVARTQRLASVGKLAAGVAHEIRNPLSSIKGFATYFKERYAGNTEDQNIANIMIREVDRLNRVVGQLLEFARPVAVSRKSVSITPFIENSLKLAQVRSENSGIKLSTVIDPQVEKARFDPDKISQVLLNLYINAIDAMNQGGTLNVEIKKNAAQKALIIAVSDTGSGISKEDLAHIFDPYFTTKSSGTGLGLAISHNIIEAHGGTVKISSREGEGTTVSLCLPDGE